MGDLRYKRHVGLLSTPNKSQCYGMKTFKCQFLCKVSVDIQLNGCDGV